MREQTRIDLENIVYYKNETHYFVMCAKKQSLLEKGVLQADYDDISSLLCADNIDQTALLAYARQAADFATEGALPHLEYALNHFGQADVAMFDFTSLFSAQCSIRLVERKNQRLIMSVVGDSLHEPFWPTGSGCARGFLGVFDAVWTLRNFALSRQGPLEILAERESIYRLLAQTTPENLHKNLQKYTIDPRTRYVSLEMSVQPPQVSDLVDTDNFRMVDISEPLSWTRTNAHLQDDQYSRRQNIIRFCQLAVSPYRLRVDNLTSSWVDGRLLFALLNRFMPSNDTNSDDKNSCLPLIDYAQFMNGHCEDPDRLIRDALSAVKHQYGIELQLDEEEGWPPDRAKLTDFLSLLIDRWSSDNDHIGRTLALVSSSEKKQIMKRKAPSSKYDISKVKKSEAIQRKSQALIDSLSGNCPVSSQQKEDSAKDLDWENFLAENRSSDNLQTEQIESLLTEWESERVEEGKSIGNRVRTLREKISTGPYMDTENATKFTKRPLVDKLHPDRLFKVEQIVNGSVEKRKVDDLYSKKRRQANIVTRRMEQKDLVEMETKLEQTAMGVLFNKDQFRVMSSKEEKLIKAKAADARSFAKEGFVHRADEQKYKSVDELLKKAEILARNRDLTGVSTVSRATKKPPPPPPKSSSITTPNCRSRSICQDITTKTGSSPFNQGNQLCALCSNIVYLAERIHVEGMYVHKRCFRCAYCGQALRLNNSAFQRDIPGCNGRFYCMKHLQLPLAEKIQRIDKDNALSKCSPDNDTNAESTEKDQMTKSEEFKTNCCTVRLLQLNSPSSLLAKTMEKMAMQVAETGLPHNDNNDSGHSQKTPERAEFECSLPETAQMIDEDEMLEAAIERHNLGYSSSRDEEEEEGAVEGMDMDNEPEMDSANVGQPVHSGVASSSDEDDECEMLSDRELKELEKTVLNERRISYQQAASLASVWKQRRHAAASTADTTPKRTSSWTADEDALTPSMRKLQFSPDSTAESPVFETGVQMKCARIGRLPSNEMDPCRREQKLREIAEFRERARFREHLKSDPESELEKKHSPRRCSAPVPNGQSILLQKNEIKRTSATSSCTASVQSKDRGLLSRIFSPERKRSNLPPCSPNAGKESPLSKEECPGSSEKETKEGNNGIKATDVLSCDSRKETSLLAKLSVLRRCKKAKSHSPSPAILYNVRADILQKQNNKDLPRMSPPPETTVHSLGNSQSPNKLGYYYSSYSGKKNLAAPKADEEDYDDSSDDIQLVNDKERGDSGTDFNLPDTTTTTTATATATTATAEDVIEVSEREVRRVQRAAERLLRHREQDRQCRAMQTQRHLHELDVRRQQLVEMGGQLERRLVQDGENRWVLEQWLLFVDEKEVLDWRETELKLRAKEIGLENRHSQLQNRLRRLISSSDCDEKNGQMTTAQRLKSERELLQETLNVVAERDKVVNEMDRQRVAMEGDMRRQKREGLFAREHCSYWQFEPVFLADLNSLV